MPEASEDAPFGYLISYVVGYPPVPPTYHGNVVTTLDPVEWLLFRMDQEACLNNGRMGGAGEYCILSAWPLTEQQYKRLRIARVIEDPMKPRSSSTSNTAGDEKSQEGES